MRGHRRFPILPLGSAAALVAGWLALAAAEAPARAQEAPATEGPGGIDNRDCGQCHAGFGASGHLPPALKGCYACHPPTDEPGTGFHVPLSPASDATCQGCHPLEQPAWPHLPYMGGMCTTCHDPHSTDPKGPFLKDTAGGGPCAGCHGRKDDHLYTHTAVRLGLCHGCHDPHGSEQAHLLKGDAPAAACADCHPAEASTDKASTHMPAAGGMCLSCHAPHGSDQQWNLVKPGARVCQGCHPAKDDTPQVHAAVRLGQCGECHDPHGSDHDRKLRTDPIDGTCFRCHYDDVTGREQAHPPVAAGRCTICHDPHGSGQRQNLYTTVNLTCGGCHPDQYRPDARVRHGAVVAYGCTSCHDPHGSDTPPFLLRGSITATCTRCHEGYDDGYHVTTGAAGSGHPTGGKRDPTRPDRDLSCTSCHDPHGGDNPKLWYRATVRIELCRECHTSL